MLTKTKTPGFFHGALEKITNCIKEQSAKIIRRLKKEPIHKTDVDLMTADLLAQLQRLIDESHRESEAARATKTQERCEDSAYISAIDASKPDNDVKSHETKVNQHRRTPRRVFAPLKPRTMAFTDMEPLCFLDDIEDYPKIVKLNTTRRVSISDVNDVVEFHRDELAIDLKKKPDEIRKVGKFKKLLLKFKKKKKKKKKRQEKPKIELRGILKTCNLTAACGQ
jgi:hypothetical protein